MTQRIWTLTTYFSKTLFRSLSGILYLIFMLAYWLLLFSPTQKTPDAAYFILVTTAFGAGMAFLITLSVGSRGNQASHYPWLVRLPSRVEYVTAVAFTTLLVTLLLQLGLALLAQINGPELTAARLLEIPPIWLSANILAIVLALHVTDLVASGWSRIYLFGLLAIALFAQSLTNNSLTNMATSLSRFAMIQGWTTVASRAAQYAANLDAADTNVISQAFSLLFWPFHAIANAVINGYFTRSEALAPAILLLYATILFMLAADLFANKDLAFIE